MKAKVKVTGEVVELTDDIIHRSVSLEFRGTTDGRIIATNMLEFETPINWEQRRYEIAKSMLAAWGSYNLGAMEALNLDSNEIIKNSRIAIEIADELIKQLKTTKQ